MTTQRVVFMDAKRTVEWAFSKLIAIQNYQNRPWTAIQVSDRQKVTGVTYDAANEHNLRLRLEAAVALFNQETGELEAQLTEAIRAHDAARPQEATLAIVEPARDSDSWRPWLALPRAKTFIPSIPAPDPVPDDRIKGPVDYAPNPHQAGIPTHPTPRAPLLGWITMDRRRGRPRARKLRPA